MTRGSIHDVAKAAGVSISTVSRAFTHPEQVRPSTRARVMEAARRFSFNISRSAGTLKTGHAGRVALLMNEEITSWFNNQTFAGIDSVLHDAGYDISVYQHIDSASTRRAFFENLPILRNVDAVFVASFAVDPEEADRLRRLHVPIIGINTPNPEGFDASVCIDDEAGMFIAAQHLIALGHRRIVYTCSAPSDSLDASIDARGRGFAKACRAACDSGRDLDWRIVTVPRGRDFADSALSALLSLDEFPDGVCCQMDMMAIPLLLKLQRYGRHAPRDYSLIGFDDSPYADTVNLTTMRQDPRDLGAMAARKALRLIGGGVPEKPHSVIRPQLVLRGTDAAVGPDHGNAPIA